MVIDAIKNDRFWVISHADLQPVIESRASPRSSTRYPRSLATATAPARRRETCRCKPKSSSASFAEMPWGSPPGLDGVTLRRRRVGRRVSTDDETGDRPDQQPAGLHRRILGESGSLQRFDERFGCLHVRRAPPADEQPGFWMCSPNRSRSEVAQSRAKSRQSSPVRKGGTTSVSRWSGHRIQQRFLVADALVDGHRRDAEAGRDAFAC